MSLIESPNSTQRIFCFIGCHVQPNYSCIKNPVPNKALSPLTEFGDSATDEAELGTGFLFLSDNGVAKMPEKDLSTQLDEARALEAHHRALLLFWKRRRQNLENQIPVEDAFAEFLKEIGAQTNDHNHTTD